MGYCGPQGSQNGSYWLLSIWSGAGSAGYQGNVPDNPHQQGERRNPSALSDETKKFHRDRYRDFFSRPKFSRPRPRLFFETKYFRDRYRDFFLRPNVFETDTETFFRDQMFSRPIPRLFFETKCFRDRYRDFFETKFFRD